MEDGKPVAQEVEKKEVVVEVEKTNMEICQEMARQLNEDASSLIAPKEADNG